MRIFKEILISVVVMIIVFSVLTGCDSTRARTLGGTLTVELDANVKLLDVDWTESGLWYLVRPMRDDEFPEIYTYQEKTDSGIMQGKVIFKEKRK